MDQLSKDELAVMIGLIQRFAATEMDQWENWKIDSDDGKVYIEISREPSGAEEVYLAMDHLLNEDS